MNQFKIGDKVRFIDNELNRAEVYFMEYTFVVDRVTDKPLCFLKFDDETGYNYPHPVSPLRLELAEPAEGSKEWALAQMQKGMMVCLPDVDKSFWLIDGNFIYRTYPKHRHAYTEQQFLSEDVNNWQLYTPAKFANVKVRDWVEIETTDGQTKQHQVTHVTNGHSITAFSIDNDVYFLTKNGSMVHMSNNAKAIRIVPPEEVEVEITLKGTVEKCCDCCHASGTFRIQLKNGKDIEMNLDDIPDQTEQVRAILKAQEER